MRHHRQPRRQPTPTTGALTDPQFVTVNLAEMIQWGNNWLDTGSLGDGMPDPEIVTVAATVMCFGLRETQRDPGRWLEATELAVDWIATIGNLAISIVHHQIMVNGNDTAWAERAIDQLAFVISQTLEGEPFERGAELLSTLRILGER